MIQRLIHTALLCLVLSACKTPEKAADGAQADPDQRRVEVDTRFQEAFFRALDFRNKGDWQKASAAFEECVTIDPKQGAAHYELARIERVFRNDLEAALDHARKAVDSAPENPWYRHEVGDVYLAMGKYDLAVKEYQLVEKLNPDDPNNLYEQANALLMSGKTKEAIGVYDKLELRSGVDEELSMQKHQLYLSIKDLPKAGEELEKLARAFPEEPRFWGMALRFYTGAGIKEKELAALAELKKCDPSDGMVRFQLSEYYALMGDEAKSFEELKAAFHTTDVTIDQKINVLLRYFSLTEVDVSFLPQAYELLQLTEEMHPGEAKSYAIYGDFLYRDNKRVEALSKFKRAIELDSSRRAIWDQLLSIEAETGQFELLKADAERALGLFPQIPEYYLYLGIACDKTEAHQTAVDNLNIGKELVFDNPDLLVQFHIQLASAHNSLRNFRDSDQSHDAALAISPNNPSVLNNYAYYLSLRKTALDKAKNMAKQANEIATGVATFQDTYAWVLYQSAEYTEALLWIERAAKGSPSNAEILEHYGDILFQLGKKEDAVAKWKAAIDAGGNTQILNNKIKGQFP
ncbi:MAG: tetratricopeptide repeat protein [Flavobacteriales bacterium]